MFSITEVIVTGTIIAGLIGGVYEVADRASMVGKLNTEVQTGVSSEVLNCELAVMDSAGVNGSDVMDSMSQSLSDGSETPLIASLRACDAKLVGISQAEEERASGEPQWLFSELEKQYGRGNQK